MSDLGIEIYYLWFNGRERPEQANSGKTGSVVPSITLGIDLSGRVCRVLHSAKTAPRCHLVAWIVTSPTTRTRRRYPHDKVCTRRSGTQQPRRHVAVRGR